MISPNAVPQSMVSADGTTVSALLTEAPNAFASLVLAHGAGAGMHHPFMAAVADGLMQRGVTTLRYQFPYMDAGRRRVDRPEVAHSAVRAITQAVSGQLPLFAGGKSFGARMTSQAQALDPLKGVRGLVFLGFPLHAAGNPSTDRATHLLGVRVPMLFVQGTRDALAKTVLLDRVVSDLGPSVTLVRVPGADHSFHVPARSGRTDAEVLADILENAAGWMRTIAAATTRGGGDLDTT